MSTSKQGCFCYLEAHQEALRRSRVLRFGFGVTAAAAIAFWFRWPLYYVAPLFAAFFLSLPLPGPTGVQVIGLFVAILVAFLVGLIFSLFLLPFPLVYVLLLGMVLFGIYYGVNRGVSPILAIMTLIAIFLLPILSLNDYALASNVMLYFLASSGLAVTTYLLAHVIIPDPIGSGVKTPAKQPLSGKGSTAAIAAVKSVIVVLPIAILFLAMNWVSEVLVIVFVAFFSLVPKASASFAEGLKALVSNVIGGLAAIIFYWLIVAVPQFHFFVVLMLFTMLIFGKAIFSSRPWSQYLPSASITMLVLIGSSIGENVDFAGTLVTRILLIGLSVLYAVGAMGILDWMLAGRDNDSSCV